MSNILIADSGGTGTDWVLISNGERTYFTTESYHPGNWNEEFWLRISHYWKAKSELFNVPLKFYGAGCLTRQVSTILRIELERIGFQSIEVKSDLDAAGAVCLDSKEGIVAILGTGSVLFGFGQKAVNQIVGGKGHADGDEGSGFYFGKLIVEKFQKELLTDRQLNALSTVTDINALSKLSGVDTKNEWSKLPKLLSDWKSDFEPIHRENIELFVKAHFKLNVPETISLVGSYAWFNQELWSEILLEKGCVVRKFVHRPIEHLID